MGLDINTKKLKKNAFRVSKERGIGASRIRVPGGYLNAAVLGMIQEIAQTYGNGYVHLTTRQGFEIEGIRFEDMEEINKKLQPIIEKLEINRIYKCVSSTKNRAFFLPHHVATIIKDGTEFQAKNKIEVTEDRVKISTNCWKLEVDRLGNIVRIIR